MKRKKFKTVAGYLRSAAEQIKGSNLPKEEAAQRVAVFAGQRTAINNLLPQLGFSNLIGPTEAPHEGVDRLLTLSLNEQQTAALKVCQRWLKNFSVAHWTVTTAGTPYSMPPPVISEPRAVTPQVKTSQGLVSYRVASFRRDDTKNRVIVIVDAKEYDSTVSPHELAERIAGPDYCFDAASNMLHAVPDEAKNRLFFSDEELYAADPQSRPHEPRRRGRAR